MSAAGTGMTGDAEHYRREAERLAGEATALREEVDRLSRIEAGVRELRAELGGPRRGTPDALRIAARLGGILAGGLGRRQTGAEVIAETILRMRSMPSGMAAERHEIRGLLRALCMVLGSAWDLASVEGYIAELERRQVPPSRL